MEHCTDIPEKMFSNWKKAMEITAKMGNFQNIMLLRVKGAFICPCQISYVRDSSVLAREIELEATFTGKMLQTKQPVHYSVIPEEYKKAIHRKHNVQAMLLLPLLFPDGTPFGSLCVAEHKPHSNLEHEAVFLLKDVIEQGLESIYLKQKVQDKINTSFSFLRHEIKEPLRMISGFLSLIERKIARYADENPELSEMIHYAVDGAIYLRDILKHLKQHEDIRILEKEKIPTNLNHTLEHVLKNLDFRIGETEAYIEIGNLPTLKVHAAFIAELFQNLISNALKYQKHDVKPEIHIRAHAIGNEYLFEVSDNGIGIAQQHRERIFEMFQRLHAKDEYEGTGLGLALCKRIVEAHGGKIWVESEQSAGATFCFTLPILH
jgi:signal transduction histidine kinase